MSSVLRTQARKLAVLATLSGSAGAFGCNSGFSSCLDLATCGAPAGEGGAAGAPGDEAPGAGNAAGSDTTGAFAGASGHGGASHDGASGQAGLPEQAGRAGADGTDEGEGGESGDGSDRTGGVGGAGGDGAEGCTSDAACDDGVACNGLERCVDAECEAGEAVECVSDANGCEAVCEEQQAGAGCVTRGADADGDGHGSSLCETSPGDDCNDDDATVHAGAPERCDALDNDCDGSADLSDGLPLGSAGVTVEGFSPSVAWSQHHGAFGLMWVARSDGASQLRGGTMSTTGTLQPWPVISFSSTTATYLSPVLADNGTGFAALYQIGSRGGQLSHLAIVGSDGSAQTTPLDGLHSDLARLDRAAFLFAGELGSSLTIETVPHDFVARQSFDTTPISPRVAAVGADAAVIWQVENTTNVDGLFYLDGQFVEAPFGAIANAASPDISAAGSAYTAAWSTPGGVFHQRMHVDGSLPCIGAEVALRAAAISDRAVAVAAGDRHSFVLVTDKLNNVVHLLRFDDECRLVDQTEIEAGAVPSRPAIAVGGGHVAACWSEGTSDNHSACRVMGVSLCEGDVAGQ
jgi:hypothetical protein